MCRYQINPKVVVVVVIHLVHPTPSRRPPADCVRWTEVSNKDPRAVAAAAAAVV